MDESLKFQKSWTFEIQLLKLQYAFKIFNISSLNAYLSFDQLYIYQKNYYILPNSAFWGWLSMESQPQNPEFRNNPENFHPCVV